MLDYINDLLKDKNITEVEVKTFPEPDIERVEKGDWIEFRYTTKKQIIITIEE